MSRDRGRRGRRPAGFTPPGWRQLYRVAMPMRGPERRRFFNELSDRFVVMLGVAAAVVGLVVGPAGAARAMVRGRFRRG